MKCKVSDKRSTALGGLNHHLETCPSAPGTFPPHDSFAKNITLTLNDARLLATHEQEHATDVSPNLNTKLTPDVIVEGNGYKFGIDVTIRRPGVAPGNVDSILRQAYLDKLTHYYGELNGQALFAAATNPKIPSHSNDFFVKLTSTSDRAIIQTNLESVPDHIKAKNLLPSPLPTMTVRPIVINGVSGRLEPLSKLFLTHLLMSQINVHYSHLSLREKKGLVFSKLSTITMRLIAVSANVRIVNMQKFLVDNSLAKKV